MNIGIDPGSAETAYCLIDTDNSILDANKLPNGEFIVFLGDLAVQSVAIEGIQSYGMAVGREVFDTCYMIGRILQKCDDTRKSYAVYPRPEYARAIAGVGKVSDAILRQALLVRFGGDKKGEPLFKLKGNSDKRSAFAIAVYHSDLMRFGRVRK